MGHVNPLPLLSHTKAWEVGFQFGAKQTAVFHVGYEARYDTTLDWVTITTVLYITFLYWTASYQWHLKRGQVTQRQTKTENHSLDPSFNSSFTAITRRMSDLSTCVGMERLASAGSLDISSRFSICGYQCSFNYKTFRTIQCLWEVSSDTLCCLEIYPLATLPKHYRQAERKNSFSSEKPPVVFFLAVVSKDDQ